MFTFEPARSLLPGAGFCEMTTPFFTLAEKAFVTFPTEQCARLIAVLAAASFLPFTFGTTHFFCDGGGGGGGEELAWKVAVAAWLALMVSVHVPVPEQSPLQPAKLEPEAAVAVRMTEVPSAKACEQVLPQSIPAGLLVTMPAPLPAFATVSVLSVSKVAVTSWSALIETVQVPVPVQAPPQPVKVEPEAVVAVRVTEVPSTKAWEQVEPQSMPAGLEPTVPAPSPPFVTVSVFRSVKVAVTG